MIDILADEITRPGSVEPAADGDVYSWAAGRIRATWRSVCTGSWPTMLRARSCSPTCSPRSRNGWQATTSCCNRPPQRGANGRSAAPRSPRIPRSSTVATTGLQRPRRQATARGQCRRSSEPPGVDDLTRLSSTLTTGDSRGRRRAAQASVADRRDAARRAGPDDRGHGRRRRRRRRSGGRGPFGSQTRRRPAPDGRLVHHVYPVALNCANGRRRPSARQLLDDVHETLNAVPHYGIGYGLLRYIYAPTARLLGGTRPADIFFSYVGTIPDLPSVAPATLRYSSTPTRRMPVREALPALVMPSSFGCIAPPVHCTSTGGTTPAGSSRRRWRRLPSTSRPRSMELTSGGDSQKMK